MPTFIQLKNGIVGIWIQAWPTPGAMGVGTEPAQSERGGVGGVVSVDCRLHTFAQGWPCFKVKLPQEN